MQIVVAGATGFVGREVVHQALERGHEVFALLRPERGSHPFDPEAVKAGRITTVPLGGEADVLERGFGLRPGARWVNAAGLARERRGEGLRAAHEDLVRELLQLASDLDAERFTHLSCALPDTGDPFVQSKRNAEHLVHTSGLPTAILRCGPVYGTGDALLDDVGAWMVRSPFIPRFLEDAPLDPVYVGDAAQALLDAPAGFHEAGGPRLAWGELLDRAAAAAGKVRVGPRLSDEALTRAARWSEQVPALSDLVPFTRDGLARHRRGYVVQDDALPRLLGRAPRDLDDYLTTEWAYRLD